ncbi:hypothetical protein GCM10011584_23540 [Nocardioides phosphati]|uniref:Uncharacterized protein n=2 Tax=Nocardioides phosphati TaxID=1867775 RepID=A0ABQ2NDQ0_9ACTN|nr:hypothetical protein GCM10011584_23540 [Nocardioides phosphati]
MNLLARAGALAAALLLAVPGAARAQRYDHSDAAGDVTRCADDACTSLTYASTQEPDIRQITIRHRTDVLTVHVLFTEIRRTSAEQGFGIQVRTDEGLFRQYVVTVKGTSVTTSFTGPSEPVACRGASYVVDFRGNDVLLRVPRACLSSPRLVRVGFLAYESVDASRGYLRADDALRRGMDPEMIMATLSPRLARG